MNKYILILLFFLNSSLSIFASPNIDARTGILIDYHSDEILYELEPDAQIYPASMTKIMTSIVAFDLIKKNKLSLDDKFIISENAWRLSQAGYSSMFIMINDEVSVEDLQHSLNYINFHSNIYLHSRETGFLPKEYLEEIFTNETQTNSRS